MRGKNKEKTKMRKIKKKIGKEKKRGNIGKNEEITVKMRKIG